MPHHRRPMTSLPALAAATLACAGVAWAARAGLVVRDGAFPPFVIVLLGLGLVELLAGYAAGRPLGALVGMPARFLAFVVGVGVLVLINGGLA